MTTKDLDRVAAEQFKKFGATSTSLGYFDFPGHICVSVNEEVVHGIPRREAAEGGRPGQGRRRGEISRLSWRHHASFGMATRPEIERLVAVTEAGNAPRNRTGHGRAASERISHAIQRHVESERPPGGP